MTDFVLTDSDGTQRFRGTASGDGASPVLTASVHVTAAEIIAIGDGTPKALVPAPDADTVLLWQAVALTYRAGSVAYDFDPGLCVTWSGFQGVTTPGTTSMLDSLISQTALHWGWPEFSFNTDDADPAQSPQGESLILTAVNVGPFTPPLGNGTADLVVYYTPTSLLPA